MLLHLVVVIGLSLSSGSVALVVYLVFLALYTVAMIQHGGDQYAGYRRPLHSLLGRTLVKTPKAVLVAMAYDMIITFGLLFFILPGLYFSARFALSIPAAVITDGGFRRSFSSGAAASRHRFLHILCLFCLQLITVFVVGSLGGSPTSLTTWLVIPFIFVFVPYFSIAYAVLYLAGQADIAPNPGQ